MVSPDPLWSTGFNGSVLNLLSQIGITQLGVWEPFSTRRMSSQPPSSRQTIRCCDCSRSHNNTLRASWIASVMSGNSGRRCGTVECWRTVEMKHDETKVALKIRLFVMDSEQLWFQSLSFSGCLHPRHLIYMHPVNVTTM